MTSLYGGSMVFDCVTANCAADRTFQSSRCLSTWPTLSPWVLSWNIAVRFTRSRSNSVWTVLILSFPYAVVLKISLPFLNQISCSFCNEACWIILRAALAVHLTIPEFIILESWILQAELNAHVLSLCGGLTTIHFNFSVPNCRYWFQRIGMGSCDWWVGLPPPPTLLLLCRSLSAHRSCLLSNVDCCPALWKSLIQNAFPFILCF
jgi:hypothetical protein